eukprot:755737-Pelagomonas_calceolata.AAC.4
MQQVAWWAAEDQRVQVSESSRKSKQWNMSASSKWIRMVLGSGASRWWEWETFVGSEREQKGLPHCCSWVLVLK